MNKSILGSLMISMLLLNVFVSEAHSKSWYTDNNSESNGGNAIPSVPVSNAEYIERVMKFVTDVDTSSTLFRELTANYKTFLERVATLKAGCDVDADIIQNMSQDNRMSWLYTGANRQCKEVNDNYLTLARQMGARLDQYAQELEGNIKHAQFAGNILKRKAQLDAAKKVQRILNGIVNNLEENRKEMGYQ